MNPTSPKKNLKHTYSQSEVNSTIQCYFRCNETGNYICQFPGCDKILSNKRVYMKHVYLAHEGGNEKRKQKKVHRWELNWELQEQKEKLKKNIETWDFLDLWTLRGAHHSQQYEAACEFFFNHWQRDWSSIYQVKTVHTHKTERNFTCEHCGKK